MTKVPVTLPLWIVQDGAASVPAVGDTVSFRVGFAQTLDTQLDALLLRDEHVFARTRSESRDQSFSVELAFPLFDATMCSDRPLRGETAVTGRLFVEYELSASATRRLEGVVLERHLIIEETDLPLDPKDVRSVGPPKNPELRVFDADSEFLTVDMFPTPVLGTSWRRPTGLLLLISLSEPPR